MRVLSFFLLFLCLYITGYARQSLTIHVEEAGTLCQLSPSIPINGDLDIKITGSLNEDDFRTLTKLVENRYFSLDLSEAKLTEIPRRAFMLKGGTDEGYTQCDAYIQKIILPATLITVNDAAFAACKSLKEVDLSKCTKLNYVGSGSFNGCALLSSVDFNNCTELKVLGTGIEGYIGPFINCSGLQNVILPPNLEVIGYATFENTGLKYIEIPSTVKEIQGKAFCVDNLIDIKMRPHLPPTISNTTFYEATRKECILKVPSGSLSRYKAVDNWKDFLNIEEYNPNGEDLITHTIQISYNDGGKVELNGNFISKDYSSIVTDQTDIQLLIEPYNNYHLKQVLVGGIDMTNKIENNLLTLPSIANAQIISISFEGNTYTTQVSYNDGGIVSINDEFVQNGSSVSVTALNTIKLSIFPDDGYRIKQVLILNNDWTNELRNNVINLTASCDYIVTVFFEKNVSSSHIVKVSYNDGGIVEINNKLVTNNSSTSVQVSTDIQLSIAPNKGFHLKQVMVGNTDMTGNVKDNLLVLPAISEDKDIKITFEKDAPTSYSFKVTYSGNGSVKVNGDIVSNGSSIALPVLNSNIRISFSPDNEFYVKRVVLGSKDITDQIVDNSYTISTLSSDLSLYVTFERIPIYSLNIQMEGGYGSIGINDKIITSSTLVSDIKAGCSISFQTNKYYDIKKVTLGDKDITDQIQNGSYTIESMESNLILKVEYVYKQYLLSIKLQGVDRIQVNGEEVTDGSSIITHAGFNRINIVSEHYLIKQVLLGDKIVYQDNTEGTNNISTVAVVELTIDGNTELTIETKLREKRELSLELKEAGTLASQLSEEDIRFVTDLHITGKIDQRDLAVMNRMPSLFNLNLGWTTIEEYGNYPANTIPEKAFYDNKNINILYLPHSIETIAKQAFSDSNIYTFQGSAESYKYLTKIEEEAFKDCQYLIEVPSIDKIPVIEKGVFENCSNLSSLPTVLSNLIEVKESAFRNCKNLSVTLEPSIEKIGDYAFENVKCVNFAPVYNGEFKLSHIGTDALKGCQNESFHFADLPYLKELPSFEGCSNMSSITFPPNVKQIPAGTFKGCTSLREVYMNENIESIADNAFSDSKSISCLYVPTKNVPEVSVNSFNDINYFAAELVVLPDYLYCYRDHPVWGKFLKIKLWGNETYRNLEAIVSEGGEVKAKGGNDTYFNDIFYAGESNSRSYLTSSRIEFIVSPKEGYSIESVFLNGENITNTLDENNTFVIPNLMFDSQIAVNFKKEKEATDIETINKTKRLYLSGFNQLTLSDFPIGTQAFVYDAGGRMIIRTTIRNNVEKVDLPGKGIYFILVDKESIKIVL